MTESDIINGWTFEETIKAATNLMEVEQNMFKWDVLRHLRDFAESYKEEIRQYQALGTVEELRLGGATDDVCEWTSVSDGEFIKNPHTKRLYSNEPSMRNIYCNTCGKKIKVVNL